MSARGAMLVALVLVSGCMSDRPVAPEVPAGVFSARGTAPILDGAGGRLELRTGDVAFRLDANAGLAGGVCPLPAAKYRTDGLVHRLPGPGSDDWAAYRRWFARPEQKGLVRDLLGDVWGRLPDGVRSDLARGDGTHPFLRADENARAVFLTVLDRWIDRTIAAEVVGTRVTDAWETEPNGRDPQVSTAESTRGELVILTPDDVRAMRGRDTADLKAAGAGGLTYRPGTPVFSDVGLIAVERVRGTSGRLMRRAFVYAAAPGEGIVRYSLHDFFGRDAATSGAFFRYRGDAGVAREAARELVDLYRHRETHKVGIGKLREGTDRSRETLVAHRGTAPPAGRARAWDSYDYAFDWRNQARYDSGELVWAHFARHGVQLVDSFSLVTAPPAARDMGGVGDTGLHIRVTPQSLALSSRLRRIADFETAPFDERFRRYSTQGNVQPLNAADAAARIKIY